MTSVTKSTKRRFGSGFLRIGAVLVLFVTVIVFFFATDSTSLHKLSFKDKTSSSPIENAQKKVSIREDTATTGTKAFAPLLISIAKPVLIDVGVLVLCQTVGMPLLAKFSLRKVRWIGPKFSRIRLSQGHHIHRALRLIHRKSFRLWKASVKLYKNTAASKVVQRSKKHIHVLMHRDDKDEKSQEKAKQTVR